MTELLVVTMATGPYKKYLYGLFKSLDFIKNRFDLCIITDAKSRFNREAYIEENCGKEDLLRAAKQKCLGFVTFREIPHMPWPIVTCCKFQFVSEAIKGTSYKYILYLDAVMRLRRTFDAHEQVPYKFTVWQHFIWDFISEDERINLHSNRAQCHSFIKPEDRTNYIHAGMFFGDANIVPMICFKTQELMNKELKEGILPQWHDESCLNYIYNENKQLFNVIEHNVYDEGAPNRYPNAIGEYMLSFTNCLDCQKEKEV